jgi:hypothetical protein
MNQLIPFTKGMGALILLFTPLVLSTSPASALPHSELRTGDVILVSLPCRICSIIEAEEGGPFSHLGLVLIENGQVRVADAYHKVASAPLGDFLKIIKPGTRPVIVRPLDAQGGFLKLDSIEVIRRFRGSYEGLSYDSEFLWNNRDAKGEKLYCSEFVAKFLNAYLPNPIETKPMHFNVERGEWIKYFKGNPPDGKPGISPADFSRSRAFQNLGTLD